MPLEHPRPGLNGSALAGLLAQLNLVPRTAAPPSLVDGLSRWLGWKDAIALSAVLQAAPAAAAVAAPQRLAALEAEFTRVRAALARTIAEPGDTAREDGRDFLPFRRHHAQQQQAMDTAVATLRAQARAALLRAGRTHPPLARLAALDAALAGALAPREQAQLALMPALLEKLYTRLRSASPGAGAAPWLPAFRHDMQRLLLAELDLRLQPAEGLLDALRTALTDPA